MFMSLLYVNVGMEAPTENDEDSVLLMSGGEYILRQPSDYQNLPVLVGYVMYAIRQSVGDLNAPGYPQWTELLETYPFGAGTMITLNWFVFLWSLYVMVIILLNFLIVVISSSYEDTEKTFESFKYLTRSEMNTEASIHLKH